LAAVRLHCLQCDSCLLLRQLQLSLLLGARLLAAQLLAQALLRLLLR
jgi:hypothetical protein